MPAVEQRYPGHFTATTQQTSRFVDPWPYVTAGVTALVILALVSSWSFQKTLLSTTVQVSEEQPAKLKPVLLKQELIGALRIDVQATIPTNQWVTYEIQLLDQQGNLLAAGIKQAWHESGTWQEEGEFGTWSESDLWGGLDVRAAQDEVVVIGIQVLEYSNTTGQELDQPVAFRVTARSGVVDTRYIWAGLFGSATLAVLGFIAARTRGTQVIKKTIHSSDVGDRATVGGPNCLVQVIVKVEADTTAPRQLVARLFVRDGNGQQVYLRALSVQLHIQKDDDRKTQQATGRVKVFLILEPQASYGFYVEVTPDTSVDWTTLLVRNGLRTTRSVEAVHIRPV